MADHSKIEWTDATWNPLRGCSRVSEGCRNCYAEKVAARFTKPGMAYERLIHPSTHGWNGEVHIAHEVLDHPLRWTRPRRIFVNSMSDLFHESVNDVTIAGIFGIMAACPQHTFQVLTKRPARMHKWFQWMGWQKPRGVLHESTKGLMGYKHPRRPAINDGPWPLPNVWLGVSVEDQKAADDRVPALLKCPAAVRWLSCEPLLGRVDLTLDGLVCHPCRNAQQMRMDPTTGAYECCKRCDYTGIGDEWAIDWVVAGGESGPSARPMHPDWARSLRDQCASAGVPFFFKQWGEFDLSFDRDRDDPDFRQCGRADRLPGRWINLAGGHGFHGERVHYAHKVGKRKAGRLLDGVEHNGFPEQRA
ncbi:phage Gp37/Gp68 family protein [Dyella sp.]|uniref:DUF5131 family protein n=1 Tax=Dyella sp. TaxID=1869338 RepID=UPI002FDB89D4